MIVRVAKPKAKTGIITACSAQSKSEVPLSGIFHPKICVPCIIKSAEKPAGSESDKLVTIQNGHISTTFHGTTLSLTEVSLVSLGTRVTFTEIGKKYTHIFQVSVVLG